MTDPPDVRLPESFAETGDPVDSNPFLASDARHGVWERATREAEQEASRIGAEALDAGKSYAEWLLDPVHPNDWLLDAPVAKFDVWAKRGVQVVCKDAEVALYDRWLLDYANAWIETLDRFLEDNPPPFTVSTVIVETRNRFGGRVQFWKGEARRRLAEQQPQTASAKVKTRRRLLVQKYRMDHDLTAEAFAHRIGMSNATVQGIVREDWTRFAEPTRDKLLRALHITVSDWYQE